MIAFLPAIGKFVYGFRTGLLDQTLTDENKRFYEGIKIVLTNAIFLSRAKWLKYIFWKAYADLNKGMKDWHAIGMKNTKKVMEQVKNAEEMGKTLEDSIGILFSFCFTLMIFLCFFKHQSSVRFSVKVGSFLNLLNILDKSLNSVAIFKSNLIICLQ